MVLLGPITRGYSPEYFKPNLEYFRPENGDVHSKTTARLCNRVELDLQRLKQGGVIKCCTVHTKLEDARTQMKRWRKKIRQGKS